MLEINFFVFTRYIRPLFNMLFNITFTKPDQMEISTNNSMLSDEHIRIDDLPNRWSKTLFDCQRGIYPRFYENK